MNSRNNVEAFNMAKDKGLIVSIYLTWSSVHVPLTSKRMYSYASLIKEKAKLSGGFTKLMSDFNLSEEETRKVLNTGRISCS